MKRSLQNARLGAPAKANKSLAYIWQNRIMELGEYLFFFLLFPLLIFLFWQLISKGRSTSIILPEFICYGSVASTVFNISHMRRLFQIAARATSKPKYCSLLSLAVRLKRKLSLATVIQPL